MENKTAEETMTSKKLFARLLAKYIGTDEDPDIATEMIGKDSEVTALYNTCLEFSAICNDLTQQQLAEKDKEIEGLRCNLKKYAETVDHRNASIIEYQEEIERYKEVLTELVELKKMKDSQGKTFIYCDRQPKAWQKAFDLIESLNK